MKSMVKTLDMPTIGRLPAIRAVQIQTHSRCNADCLFCPYIESEHAADPGTMSDELWHRILDNLQPFAKTINEGKMLPYFMQEPLIDRTIFIKIEDIYRYFSDTCVEVSTNGAALTDKIVDKLFTSLSGKRHDIWVSHHGINKETLEHIMKIDYDKAHRQLIAMLKKSNGRFQIKIRGAGEARDGKRAYFTKQQYEDYWARNFEDHGINTTNVNVDAFTFHDRAGTLHREDRGACDLKVGKVREIGLGHAPFHCPRIDEWLHFDYRGNIYICCMDYHHEVKLPNVQDVWLPNYFRSEAYRNLMEMVSGRRESPDDFICKRCLSPGG